MMLENEKQITIVDEQGNEHLMQVLFTYDNEERKTSYVFFYSEENGNLPIVVSASKAAQEKGLLAGNVIRQVAQCLGGSGGGRPDMASGAGKDASKVDAAIELVKGLVK